MTKTTRAADARACAGPAGGRVAHDQQRQVASFFGPPEGLDADAAGGGSAAMNARTSS